MTSTSGDLAGVYRDLHAHPELGFAEHRTAAIVADRLTRFGYEVTTGVGRTGVVGILRNGDGPTALLRADMDGLPVAEATGLPYASTDVAPGEAGDVPVMHACGHDMHVTALLGAAEQLADDTNSWAGTLMLVFQPAEELGAGAQAMLDDGVFERFGHPEVVLGQHVAPLPAGVLGLRAGPAFAAADVLRIVLHGRGAHGSRPEVSVDPVVMAAATVMRLQTVVSREVGASETAVVTVGVLKAGTAVNIIPDHAELLVSVRTFTVDVRDRVVAGIGRIARAEADASGAPKRPEVELTSSFPAVSNDQDAVDRTRPALQAIGAMVVDPGPVTGSEDVGLFGIAAGAPCVYWLLGGADPARFEGAADFEEIALRTAALPSNHSPLFAPVIEPTLTIGVNALVAAAHTWLPRAGGK
ncbi:MAG TPA: amidohydrolase [Dermatophilaceae bacterium]|nr:amidohydrolase [Dermatophilaceae bacterium]